jgi:hypothetical protein
MTRVTDRTGVMTPPSLGAHGSGGVAMGPTDGLRPPPLALDTGARRTVSNRQRLWSRSCGQVIAFLASWTLMA